MITIIKYNMLPIEKRIKTREDLKRFIKTERAKYGNPWGGGILLTRERDILAMHNYLLRKAEYHKNVGNKIRYVLYRFGLARLQNKYCLRIPLNCCDEGLKIMHVGPILMNGNGRVGKNCSIHINTGLVANGLNSEAPTLGDGVVVGFGAVVLGGVTIADNVAIGANAVVTRDILETNVAVAGVPAKIISNNGRLNWNNRPSNI
ncbi:MAG: serine acetyltransferase [Prevotella sp.]|nr:serine acetyltransferase [Prevotella sp.]